MKVEKQVRQRRDIFSDLLGGLSVVLFASEAWKVHHFRGSKAICRMRSIEVGDVALRVLFCPVARLNSSNFDFYSLSQIHRPKVRRVEQDDRLLLLCIVVIVPRILDFSFFVLQCPGCFPVAF